MKKIRWFGAVALVLGVALAGCGRVSPVAPAAEVTSAAVIEIGSDGSATMDLVAALYVAALTADGQAAALIDVVPGTETLALAEHSPVAMPVFAGTLLQQYNTDNAPEAAEVVAGLAAAVAPELAVLETGKVDGGLVWAVTRDSAAGGVADLTAVGGWAADKVVVAPAFALTSPSGVPALEVAYGSDASIEEVDDPVARRDAVVGGSADAAGFRRTETRALADLVELDDPMGIVSPDPLVVLLAADLAEQRPDAVLVLDAVQQALTSESLAQLAHAAEQDGAQPAIAEWLAAEGLAG